MRIKATSRSRKTVRPKKKAAPRISRGAAAGAVGVAAVVFIGAAAMMSARTPAPPAATRPAAAKIDTAAAASASDFAIDPMPAADASQPQATTGSAVTIVGCVERDAEGLRLVETSGEAAPRARSWKSGFLRKRSAPIDLVGVPKSLKLPAYVGQRVSVTGTLEDRELQVRSVKRVAASCTN